MSGLVNPTVARITLRATLSRKRALLFAGPGLVLIVLTAALRASRAPARPWPSHVLGTFGFSVLLPLTALNVLVWEVLLANFVGGVRLLSVSHYGLGIANGFVADPALGAGLNVLTSVVMGIIVTGAALVLAANLLSSFTLKGEPA
jgi:hypothetical protein